MKSFMASKSCPSGDSLAECAKIDVIARTKDKKNGVLAPKHKPPGESEGSRGGLEMKDNGTCHCDAGCS